MHQGLIEDSVANYRYYLTGYIGVADVLRAITEKVEAQKKKHPSFIFCCDPVMGDNNAFYVTTDQIEVYRDHTFYMADILLPNIFEFEFAFITLYWLALCYFNSLLST